CNAPAVANDIPYCVRQHEPDGAIARQMAIRDGEVRVLLHRARVRLRTALEAVSPNPRADQ
ncbi:MAG TPA: hypothetical protein VHX68_13180, partial [Planctomycetaceae bacterium]|nr:hypothetical protein [Planctomycetaceae bacterium]